MLYDLNEHKHRYAIWTAARAVQRSFTTTTKISYVINSINLRAFAESVSSLKNQSQFDFLQKKWCHLIINEFDKLQVPTTYGQASKIVAVYLKTSVIINSNGSEDYLKFIHPPIDRIIVKNLPDISNLKELKRLNWTKIDEQSYWDMVARIREQLKHFDWRLEMLWSPEQTHD